MDKIKEFRDLIAWQKAHNLVLETYKVTSSFPKEELYGLTSQLKRAIISVPANIAEGFKRKGYKDKARFYNIAQASLNESYYYFILASDLNFADTNNLTNKYDEVSRLLCGLIKSTEKHDLASQ
jgi:four helix bundle protein